MRGCQQAGRAIILWESVPFTCVDSPQTSALVRRSVGVVTQLDTHPVWLPARGISACQLSSPGAGITHPVWQIIAGSHTG
jgi:hypothetical protein